MLGGLLIHAARKLYESFTSDSSEGDSSENDVTTAVPPPLSSSAKIQVPNVRYFFSARACYSQSTDLGSSPVSGSQETRGQLVVKICMTVVRAVAFMEVKSCFPAFRVVPEEHTVLLSGILLRECRSSSIWICWEIERMCGFSFEKAKKTNKQISAQVTKRKG